MIFWLWTLGFVAFAGALFCGLILLARRLQISIFHRRTAVIVLWIVVATAGCWLLFTLADAQAASVHRRNVGIPIIYLYFWFLALVPSPLVGFGMSRLAGMGARLAGWRSGG
jgi:hypothetical protein